MTRLKTRLTKLFVTWPGFWLSLGAASVTTILVSHAIGIAVSNRLCANWRYAEAFCAFVASLFIGACLSLILYYTFNRCRLRLRQEQEDANQG